MHISLSLRSTRILRISIPIHPSMKPKIATPTTNARRENLGRRDVSFGHMVGWIKSLSFVYAWARITARIFLLPFSSAIASTETGSLGARREGIGSKVPADPDDPL